MAPCEIEKKTFFVNNFKIQGGARPPPSDAHGGWVLFGEIWSCRHSWKDNLCNVLKRNR